MSEADTPVSPGDVLAGKYRVEKVLGAGGMGVVVQATHLQLGSLVALKFLHSHSADRADVVARFMREARAAARVTSEHVARILDYGMLEGRGPYLVLEYLSGRDLAALLHEQGPLPVDRAVDYVLQACEAIAEAHRAGIVHRDLKPANLFLTRRADGSELVKVLDFGISKVTEGPGEVALAGGLTATRDGAMGSPLYMAPEQVRSAKHVTAQADLWSLGVILYELVSGASPFRGETMAALFAAIVADPPRPLCEVRPTASAALEAVVARCLEKDVSRRYQSVGELALALVPFAPARSKLSVERVLALEQLHSDGQPQTSHAPARSPAEAHDTRGAWGNTRPGLPARVSRVWLAGGAAAFVVGALSLWALLRTGPAPLVPIAATAPVAKVPDSSVSRAPLEQASAPPSLSAPPPARALPAQTPSTSASTPLRAKPPISRAPARGDDDARTW